jgi:hypothetical protein
MKSCGEKNDAICAELNIARGTLWGWTRHLSRPQRGQPQFVPEHLRARNKYLSYDRQMSREERMNILTPAQDISWVQQMNIRRLIQQLFDEAKDEFIVPDKKYLTSWRIAEMVGVPHGRIYEFIKSERDKAWRWE